MDRVMRLWYSFGLYVTRLPLASTIDTSRLDTDHELPMIASDPV